MFGFERFIDHNSSPDNNSAGLAPLPFGQVFDRAVELYAKRWSLYTGVSLGILAVETALYLAFHQSTATIIGEIFLLPLVVLTVTIGVANDILDGHLTVKTMAARGLRRAVPVIVIDYISAVIWASGYGAFSSQSGSPSYPQYVLGALTLALCGTLFFADVWATLADEVPWYALVPLAFFRSIALAWQGSTIFRILLLVALQIPPLLVSILLTEWIDANHVSGSWFFANVPLETLLAGPFQALFTVSYFDAVARERGLAKP